MIRVGRFAWVSTIWMTRAVAWLDRKVEQRRSRRMLALISDAQLEDIGLVRDEPVPDIIRPIRD